MSIKFTAPTNLANLKLGNIISFQGSAANEIVKVELIADANYKLGEVSVFEGNWTLNYPFNRPGKRRITANGFNASNQKLSSDAIEILLVGDKSNEIGIDVSNHNGNLINWQSVKNSDVSFAFAKATEGITYIDPCFSDNWKQMKAAGLIRGAYHFFRPLRDANEQAQNFLKVVGKLELGDLPPVLDLEHYPEEVEKQWQQIDLDERIQRVQQWLDVVEQETGRKTLIYTSSGFWKTYMGDTQVFTKYPLWIAHYTTKPQPLVPANNWGENGWLFWQYTETGSVAGVRGDVDRNRFAGSFEQLLAFVKDSFVA
ncbi:glycoside hydrolase family 25 protein [Calothrix sp. 336/3]|uniref:glycoside hydrolase family 25 protein n=1 Tax=Calothrix sp. 336/3 TaxID=1337936 RepID=UPI00069BA531|nr:glycoside hydrolase family 25 protein [Calothrix sp. 336/3]